MPLTENCTQCGKQIETMAFRGTGVCGDLCRKARDGDKPSNPALSSAPVPVPMSTVVKVNQRGVPHVES